MDAAPSTGPVLYGDALQKAIAGIDWTPPFLIEHLIAQDATWMMTSDGSVGKSTIGINLMVAASAGLPVFGHFDCAKPLKVAFVLGERTWREPVRRIRHIAKTIQPNCANLFITDFFSGSTNLLMDAHADRLIETVGGAAGGRLDLCYLDPLYPFVSGALSDDKVGNQLTRQLTRIKRALCDALLLNHHNVKTRHTDKGEAYKPTLAYFGSVWLYNHVTCNYSVEREGDSKTLLRCQKDNWGIQIPLIPLDYDRETDTVTLDPRFAPKQKAAAVHLYLEATRKEGRTFSRDEIIGATGISAAQLYRIFSAPPWAGKVVNTSPGKQSAIYKVEY